MTDKDAFDILKKWIPTWYNKQSRALGVNLPFLQEGLALIPPAFCLAACCLLQGKGVKQDKETAARGALTIRVVQLRSNTTRIYTTNIYSCIVQL
eukprot:COSAG05_NODE_4963_length_1308_cov_2.986766_1_plen_95_part_00